jgi:hypothetical protein
VHGGTEKNHKNISKNIRCPVLDYGPVTAEYRIWDSFVGAVMIYGLDCQGSILGRKKIFSLLHRIQTSSGAYPAFNAVD